MTAHHRRLAAGVLLASFEGLDVPDWMLRLIEDGLGGATLYGFNVTTFPELAALSRRLRSANDRLVVSLDEEGGDVTRLHYAVGSPYPGNAALGAVDDVVLTEQVYAAIGADLAGCGINLNFAPTVDVNAQPTNPVIGTRSFGAEPELVSRHAAAAVRGLQSAGVSACVKHFPGHGSTIEDSHLELPTVDGDLDVVRRRDLPPFAAAIEAGTRSVMTAHLLVPGLTERVPATHSHAAITGLLREELGFTGVIVSDALDMQGVRSGLTLPEVTIRALEAGVDLLCLGPTIGRGEIEAIIEGIAAAITEGRLDARRIEEAVERVGAMPVTAPVGKAAPAETRADGELGLVAARRALSVHGGPDPSHGPLVPREGTAAPLVVELDQPPGIAAGTVPWGLREALAAAMPAAEFVRVEDTTAHADLTLRMASGRPLVVVVRDAHRRIWQQRFVDAIGLERPDVVVVEMGLPIWRPTRYAAWLTSHGAARSSSTAVVEWLSGGLVASTPGG